MMSFCGRTVEENHAHQANCPSRVCTAWWDELCGIAHVGGMYCTVENMVLVDRQQSIIVNEN